MYKDKLKNEIEKVKSEVYELSKKVIDNQMNFSNSIEQLKSR